MSTHPQISIVIGCKKKLLVGVLLACFSAGVCLIQGLVIQGIVFACCFILIGLLQIKSTAKVAMILNSIWCAFAAVVTVLLSQLLLNVGIAHISTTKLLWTVVLIEFVISVLFLITMNYRATVITCLFLSLTLSTINHFVFWFRGSEFAPYDFLAITTALNVAEQYSFKLTHPMLYTWIIGVLYCYLGYALSINTVKRSCKKSVATILFATVLLFSFWQGTKHFKAQHFGQMGSYNNGYLLNFSLQIRNLAATKPAEYSLDVLQELELTYSTEHITKTRNVDVIVIMSEAFGDLSIFHGPLDTNTAVMPFVQSLHENTVKGHTLVSGIGGGTSNSEYEFLTSNSLGLLPLGCFPFQQYVEPNSYSIVAGFENMNYTSMGTHPAAGGNWMRTTVYPHLGFDKYHFIEDYPTKKILRGMVSDEEMFQQLIHWYEEATTMGKQFYFGVTMQNHSPYDFTDVEFSNPVLLNGLPQKYPEVEQYLSLLNESDAAFKKLISYFDSIEDDVVIMVFGDHMPQLTSAFYEELHGSSFATLEEQMLQYTVPFFIWANYDIDEKDVGLTSLNFLSNYLYETAGLPLPAYNAFLKDVQEVIPAMNAFGYYSKTRETFIPYEEAEGKEAEILELYRILQYNSLFDKENRSQVFFPTAS